MATTDKETLVLAYRTADSVEARSLAAELQGAEIETQIIGDFRDLAYPGLLIGSMPEKELWIFERDRPAAKQIVDQWQQTYHGASPVPLAPSKFQYSMRAALVAFTVAAVSLALLSFGPQALAFGVLIAVYLVFFVYAGKRVLQRRGRDDENEENDDPLPDEQRNHVT